MLVWGENPEFDRFFRQILEQNLELTKQLKEKKTELKVIHEKIKICNEILKKCTDELRGNTRFIQLNHILLGNRLRPLQHLFEMQENAITSLHKELEEKEIEIDETTEEKLKCQYKLNILLYLKCSD